MVTFLVDEHEQSVNLQKQVIGIENAANLRKRLKCFAEEGNARRWMLMTTFKRGDIALVLFPDLDLKTGKKRPVLIVVQTIWKLGFISALLPWSALI
mgnify:CR=1 FL=1